MDIASLVSSVEKGESYGGRPSHSDPDRPTLEIHASLIRTILIGLPVTIPGEPERKISITSAGLHISSATITGHLNLDDLTGAGGAALPALRFEGCWFDSPEGISCKRSHLRSLALLNCRVTQLQAEETIIDGPVKIFRTSSPPKMIFEDQAGSDVELMGTWVVLRGARIAGHVDCSKGFFESVPRPEGADPFVSNSKHARYALDLRATEISGSVLLRPGVTAFGGISFNLARINGSVWASGANLVSGEENAFSADYADIQGSLYLRTYDPPEKKGNSIPFTATGEISLFAATLGGSLYMEGAILSCNPGKTSAGASQCKSLDASNATIGGNCKLSGWQSDPQKERFYTFHADGLILISAASIRNDLIFWGATFGSLVATNIKVGGDFNGSIYDRPIVLASNSTDKLRMTANDIHIEGAVIDGDLLMLGAKLGQKGTVANKETGLFARSVRIGGNCHLSSFPYEDDSGKPTVRFECAGRVHMQEASIGNSLVMAGAEVIWDYPGAYSAVDFSGTTIGGHAKFMTWQPENGGTCIPFQLTGGSTALRLAGTKIAQKLILNGALISSTKLAIDAANIEIGGKASLHTYKEKIQQTEIYPFVASGQVNFTAASIKLGLDMTEGRFKAIAAAPRFEDCKSVALDLTQAHAKFVRLDEVVSVGKIILEHAEIDTYLNATEAHFQGRVVADHLKVGATLNLTGSYIWSGYIRELHNETVRPNLSATQKKEKEQRLRDSLSKRHAGKQIDADLSLHSARVGGALVVNALTIFPYLDSEKQSDPYPPDLNYITVDLRGLQVQELQDEGGRGWGQSVRFWLDGFYYARLNPPTSEIKVNTQPSTGSLLFFRGHKDDEVWRSRLEWLNLQYSNQRAAQRTEFTPDAYEQVVRIFNVDGLYHFANKIASDKITRERKLNPRWRRKILWVLFWFFFDYGFSPSRAIITFVCFVLIGSGAAWVANYGVPGFPHSNIGHVLFANHTRSQVMMHETKPIEVDTNSDESEKKPCETRVRSLLYALDVFVPVLDLRQQTACSIDHERTAWRYGQAAYAVLGWILTPITLLTISGVLKKHLER